VRVGRNEFQNITERETKRQRDRPKDLDYKRRFSVSSDLPIAIAPQFGRYSAEHDPVGGDAWPREDGAPIQQIVTSEFGQRVVVKSGRLQVSPVPSVPSPGGQLFQIKLIHSGQTVLHQVWDQMLVSQLAEEAGTIFGLDPAFIVLMLFSALPQTLDQLKTIAGPPRVLANASVFVFLGIIWYVRYNVS
jgi:hypothetical protein